jgi:FAD/FMN-containing dehydrogenase
MPKLVLQAEFTSDNEAELENTIARAVQTLEPLHLRMRVVKTRAGINKYHAIRRESFNLLRHKIHGKQAAPFIDDFVVPPECLQEFLPRLELILRGYKLIYTVAGHIGDGNFHIIPLMDLSKEKDRAIIPELSAKVYDLVLSYGGSITGEHNDGLIRSYYLKKMFGQTVYNLFEDTKRIFDPQNIFNPGKKVGSSLQYSMDHMIRPTTL